MEERISSTHVQPVKPRSEAHNARKIELEHVHHELTNLNDNWECEGHIPNAELLQKIKDDYMAFHGKKLPANATPIREAVVVLEKGRTMEQLLQGARECEKQFGLMVRSISIHRDEGHSPINQDGTFGEFIPNEHAHITFLWYDFETHKTCKLGREDTSKMQDIFAQATDMERGIKGGRKGLKALEYKIREKMKELEELEAIIEARNSELCYVQAERDAKEKALEDIVAFSRFFENMSVTLLDMKRAGCDEDTIWEVYRRGQAKFRRKEGTCEVCIARVDNKEVQAVFRSPVIGGAWRRIGDFLKLVSEAVSSREADPRDSWDRDDETRKGMGL